MHRSRLARACSASAFFSGLLLPALGAAHAGYADDAADLARALLSKPLAARQQRPASPTDGPAGLADAQQSARRLLAGAPPAAANRSPMATAAGVAAGSMADEGGIADASALARRMIVGKGS